MLEETKVAVKAAREAGKILMSRFGKRLEFRDKGKGGIRDLVTQADLESNRKIISTLKAEFPDHGILSEELPEEKSSSGFRWVIDPIDGTHNFAYGIPLFGISIALEKDGKVILGVINMPYFKQMYVVERGKGSTLNGKKIHVSDRGIKEAMVVLGADKSKPDKTVRVIKELMEGVFEVRKFGAAIIHYAYLATGSIESYIDLRNKPWDNAAGFLLVEEAGGKITDFSGNDWDINTIPLIASNGRVHEEILRIVNQ